ncbi:MAG TPA: ATP-binding cassette domain-containing protein [Bacillota bacterium]
MHSHGHPAGSDSAAESAVRARGLVKRYGSLEAVRGIDFDVPRQACFGFLGPNGAGKTSTMNMITGRGTVTAGTLQVLGMDVTRFPARVRARLGIVPQENNLDPDLTLAENLEIYARYFGIDGTEARKRTQALLAFMQLEGKAKERVDALSGGMKRRAVIARALLNEPEMIVLDEPTTGLDPQARLLVWQALRRLRDEGRTLLLTTHYMEEASRLCDRLVIMDHGRIIAEGAPQALIREQVSPWVLEVHGSAPDLGALPGRARALVRRIERAGDTSYLYNDDNDALLDALRASGRAPGEYLARPANLEDLFVILTGRELRE